MGFIPSLMILTRAVIWASEVRREMYVDVVLNVPSMGAFVVRIDMALAVIAFIISFRVIFLCNARKRQ